MIAGYVVSAGDWLWLLRAVQAEGPSHVDVARALVSLWALARSRGSRQSIAELVRSYSQPVNPRHAHGGELDADRSVVSLAEKRREVAASLQSFSPGVALAVARALTTSYAGDVTDFAAHWVDASAKRYEPRSEAREGRNRLWTRAPGWEGYRVERMTNSERVVAIRGLLRALPESERRQIEGAMLAVLSRYPSVGADGGLLDGVKVIRPGEPGYEQARASAVQPVESDLALANWLDGVYQVVSDRVSELGGAAVNAVETIQKPVSSLLWAGAAFVLVMWLSRE